ncbi:Os07g0584675 [Oryza sativa Japonica Group]|uniref:Os07g0584675 protein n=1 Tax=Oryza sativa subsp. japonica TaxID=39947 RepID=A0A0P0X864_ORYSJ|nr:Os07g0584675 [Oryza sativa Japonica Group]
MAFTRQLDQDGGQQRRRRKPQPGERRCRGGRSRGGRRGGGCGGGRRGVVGAAAGAGVAGVVSWQQASSFSMDTGKQHLLIVGSNATASMRSCSRSNDMIYLPSVTQYVAPLTLTTPQATHRLHGDAPTARRRRRWCRLPA